MAVYGFIALMSVALGALVASHPGASPYIVGVALLVGAGLLNPLTVLTVAILLAPLDTSFLLGPVQLAGVKPSDALVFILIGASAVRCALMGQIRVPRMALWAVTLGVTFFVAFASSPFVDVSGLRFIGQVAATIGAYFVARYARVTAEDRIVLRRWAHAIVGSLILSGLLTVLTVALGRSVETAGGEDVSRFSGSLGGGSFAFFLLVPLILTLAALSVRVTRGRLLGLGVIGIALLATVTRSAIIAAAVAVVYFAFVYGTGGRALITVLAALLLGAVFFVAYPNALNRFRPSGEVSQRVVEGNVIAREEIWRFVWHRNVAPSPIVGSGLGATAPIFAGETLFHTGAGGVHNDYLAIWAQIGFLGVAGYVAYLLSLLISGLRTALRDRATYVAPDIAILQRAIPPLIMSYMIVSYSDNIVSNFTHFGIPLMILVGFGARIGSRRDVLARTRISRPDRRPHASQ
jgi:O-antigen ligase